MSALGLAGLATFSPWLVQIVIAGIIAGVCFYGWRETELRGWRLLAISAAIRVVAQLPHLYALILMRTEGPSSYGRFLMMMSWADMILTPVTALLTIGGFYVLLDECRRLLRR